jgi:hypothetical protein
MIESQAQRMYNAILARGTRSVPTFAEVQRDVSRDEYSKINIQIRF